MGTKFLPGLCLLSPRAVDVTLSYWQSSRRFAQKSQAGNALSQALFRNLQAEHTFWACVVVVVVPVIICVYVKNRRIEVSGLKHRSSSIDVRRRPPLTIYGRHGPASFRGLIVT